MGAHGDTPRDVRGDSASRSELGETCIEESVRPVEQVSVKRNDLDSKE